MTHNSKSADGLFEPALLDVRLTTCTRTPITKLNMTDTPHYHPPPGLPPAPWPPVSQNPEPEQPEPPMNDAPPNNEPPPPYTAKANDPLPTWSQANPRFTDLATHESPAQLSRLPLDPPPDCFSTPTPPRIRTRSFEPFRIPSHQANLAGGFRLLYPQDHLAPHGVSSTDWLRFLQDLGITARLASEGISIRGNNIPHPSGFLRGRTGSAYDASFVKTPLEEVQGLINVWNEAALERRKVRVSLQTRVDAGGRYREGYDLLVESL